MPILVITPNGIGVDTVDTVAELHLLTAQVESRGGFIHYVQGSSASDVSLATEE